MREATFTEVGLMMMRDAFVQVSVSAQRATTSLYRMKRALVLIDAPTEAGDWSDDFSLLNRYLRTGLEPENITGERWES